MLLPLKTVHCVTADIAKGGGGSDEEVRESSQGYPRKQTMDFQTLKENNKRGEARDKLILNSTKLNCQLPSGI